MSNPTPKNLHVLKQPAKITRAKRDVPEKKELKKSLRDELAEYPPSLRDMANFVIDNNQMHGLKALCFAVFPCADENTGEIDETRRAKKWANIKTHMRRIEKEKGLDFRDLLVRIADDMNILRVPLVISVIYDEAMKGNVRAADLFLRSQGVLGRGSGGKKDEKTSDSPLQPAPLPEFKDPDAWE